MKNLRWRIFITIGIFIIAILFLIPTIQYYTLSSQRMQKMSKEKLNSLRKRALHLGLDLRGGMHLLLEVKPDGLEKEKIRDARDRVIEIVRNRIDAWGVFEPSIQAIGDARVLIQLPGVMERERARELIGKTAQLTFHLVAEPEEIQNVFNSIEKNLQKELNDTIVSPFLSLLRYDRGDIVLREENFDSVQKLIDKSKSFIPEKYIILWGRLEERGGIKLRPVYLLKKSPELTGEYIADARHTVYQGGDPSLQGRPIVELSFDKKGTIIFSRVTEQNVGKRLAIVLDNIVQSAPVIRERIPGGNAMISGMESMEEAKELAIVLRSGALPAPVEIVEERSVGPLLGSDSIKNGIRSAIVGGIVVMLFMGIYYLIGGLIANFALILNLIFVLALLATFRGTLTLPGIAGIVLVIGMAVDANVLIFERLREEIGSGKSLKSAVDTGYGRAFVTILDANLTTIIAALVLLWFGTGPIRGFGLTLSLGIICSFFTAVFVTKIFFDYMVNVKKVKKIYL
ncbi:MAG: protein translocase subunit SecD [candidate division WOR-3 bacterium]